MHPALLHLRVLGGWVCYSWPVTLFLFWTCPGKSCQIQNFLLPQTDLWSEGPGHDGLWAACSGLSGAQELFCKPSEETKNGLFFLSAGVDDGWPGGSILWAPGPALSWRQLPHQGVPPISLSTVCELWIRLLCGSHRHSFQWFFPSRFQ